MLSLGALLVRALLLLLGAPPRLLLLPGAGRNPAETPPQQVNGMLGGSAWFSLKLPPTKGVVRTEWFFRTGPSGKILIATFKDGELEWQNTNGRFGQRLEVAEETTLRIRALQMEDSGSLMAQVIFANGKVLEQTFLLSVFEPLPDPQIRHHVTSRTAEACNVTLQCLASEEGAFNTSWKRGTLLPVLGEDSDWCHFSPNGTDLHLSWRPNSSNSTFTCQLSNPVDQKNASVDLLSICPREGFETNPGNYRERVLQHLQDKQNLCHAWAMWLLLLLAAVLVAILAAAGVGICLCKKRASQADYSSSVPEKKGAPEVQYAELQRGRNPPEGNENQDPDCDSPCLAETPTVRTPATIYAVVQPPVTT